MRDVTAEYEEKEEATPRKPVELYHIWKLNEDVHYRYTSGDVAVVYNGNFYTIATVERDSVQYDTKLEGSSLTIRAARITTPVIEYLAINPLDLYWIEVLKLFRDQVPLEASVIFLGQIRAVRFQGVAAEVECAGFEVYLNRAIPRYRYSPSCNHVLYDSKCGLDKNLYKTVATLTDVSSDKLELTSANFATQTDDYFTYGYVEFGNAKRMVVYHISNVVKLNYYIPNLVAGNTINIYAGCDLSIEMCRNKFNNVVNFLGFPWIPVNNPAAKIF